MLTTELIPSETSGSQAVMVVLHGLGDSIEGYRWMPGALRIPELNYVLVNAPDAYYGGYSWYDYEGEASSGIERSRGLLQEVLDRQWAAGFDPGRSFLFGFSQGCLMTLEMGVRYGRRLAGWIGISGYVHQPAELVRGLSAVAREQAFLVTHGTEDPLIPFPEVKRQIAGLQAAGLQIEWHEFHKAHTIAGEEELGVVRSFVRRRLGS